MVWGTGFVGKMVIAEVVKHPLFELVGVGVSNPTKWAATSVRSAAWPTRPHPVPGVRAVPCVRAVPSNTSLGYR